MLIWMRILSFLRRVKKLFVELVDEFRIFFVVCFFWCFCFCNYGCMLCWMFDLCFGWYVGVREEVIVIFCVVFGGELCLVGVDFMV